MWLEQIFPRYPALLQFRHSTSAETLQSFSVCTVLPCLLHFPLKKASAFSFLSEGLLWRGFLAWLLFEAWLVCFVMLNALSPFCTLHLSDLSQPRASLRMNCHVMPTPWRRSSFRNCGERHPQMKIIAMISCCVMSLRSHSSARSRMQLEYWTMDSPRSCGSLKSSMRLESSGCRSDIQSGMMSMQDWTSSSLGSGVNTGVLSLIRL